MIGILIHLCKYKSFSTFLAQLARLARGGDDEAAPRRGEGAVAPHGDCGVHGDGDRENRKGARKGGGAGGERERETAFHLRSREGEKKKEKGCRCSSGVGKPEAIFSRFQKKQPINQSILAYCRAD